MEATISRIVCQAKECMIPRDIDGWLLYDYRGMNPIFWETIGYIPNVTRPCWLWIPAKGDPKLLVSQVDQNRFVHLGIDTMSRTADCKEGFQAFIDKRDPIFTGS